MTNEELAIRVFSDAKSGTKNGNWVVKKSELESIAGRKVDVEGLSDDLWWLFTDYILDDESTEDELNFSLDGSVCDYVFEGGFDGWKETVVAEFDVSPSDATKELYESFNRIHDECESRIRNESLLIKGLEKNEVRSILTKEELEMMLYAMMMFIDHYMSKDGSEVIFDGAKELIKKLQLLYQQI